MEFTAIVYALCRYKAPKVVAAAAMVTLISRKHIENMLGCDVIGGAWKLWFL